jgi:Family of unknown function (DUF6056)
MQQDVADRDVTHWSKHVLAVLLTFALAPFLALSFFAHPAADDYVFAIKLRELGFIGAQYDWYIHWTGRFVSSALISAASYDLRWYPIVPLCLLSGLAVAVLLLVRAVSARHAALGDQLLATLAALTIYVSHMPSPAHGLYWASASVTSQAGNIFFLLAVGLVVAHERGQIRALTCAVFGGLLLAAAGGSNETTMVAVVLLTVLALWSALVFGIPARRVSIALLAAALSSAAVVIGAPGNALRQMHYPSPGAPVDALLGAGRYAIEMSLAWALQASVLSAVLLLLPWVARIPLPERVQTILGRWPPLSLASLSLLPSAILVALALPSLAATGAPPIRRTENIVLAVFLLVLFAALIPAISVGIGPLPRHAIVPHHLRIAARLLLALACLTPSVRTAWKDLLVRAAPYKAELEKRDEALSRVAGHGPMVADTSYRHGEGVLDVGTRAVYKVPPLSNPPATIHHEDIDVHPGHFKNRALAIYWGLEAIALEPAAMAPGQKQRGK